MGASVAIQILLPSAGIAFGAALTYFLLREISKRQIESMQAQTADKLNNQKEQLLLEKQLAESLVREQLSSKHSELELGWQAKNAEVQRLAEAQNVELENFKRNLESFEASRQQLESERRNLDHFKSQLLIKQESLEEQLASISKISTKQAKEMLIARAKETYQAEAEREGKQIYSKTLADSRAEANRSLLSVMERNASDFLTEATVAVVPITNEEMKGRIIGRDGRNIRAFEQAAGVDLIIDETPEVVTISCFEPVRREIARLALMNLMIDGRIHPGRIEEIHEAASQEVNRMLQDAGQKAALKAQVFDLPQRVIETMGKLRLRTSYAQNVLDHSVEVSKLSANLAAELGFNVEIARLAGFLHDIGKALTEEYEGPHALAGMSFLQEFAFKPAVLNAVGAHHREIIPEFAESEIVIIADTLSAARPGARRENLELFTKRLESLEKIANKFEGVERSFALQAGREIRVVVNPATLDDLACFKLAKDIAAEIEASMEYPGQVKVTVIREMRISETAL